MSEQPETVWSEVEWHAGVSERDHIEACRNRYQQQKLLRKAWTVGLKVTPSTGTYMTDQDGTQIYAGEVGEIVRVTRSTMDVMGPHGLMRSRPKYHFLPAVEAAAVLARNKAEEAQA